MISNRIVGLFLKHFLVNLEKLPWGSERCIFRSTIQAGGLSNDIKAPSSLAEVFFIVNIICAAHEATS
jgi:hypothetical protein